jgi:hypothetical protein
MTNNRSYIYYNNCSGAIVVDRNGKITDYFSTADDWITISLIIVGENRTIRFYKNEELIYENVLPPQLGIT